MTMKSLYSFDKTDERLEAAIQASGLRLFAVIDHGAEAAAAGQRLGRSRLYIFGNPKAGTAFMQANPEFGLELPLKALVYETDAGVFVTTSNIASAAARHNVSSARAPVGAVAQLLEALVHQASGQAQTATASAA